MYRLAIAATMMTLAAPAQAVIIEYEFNGTVQNDPSNNIRILGDNGLEPYSGSPVSLPFRIGEVITFAFQALLPTNVSPPPADGIYRFRPSIGAGDNGARVSTTITRKEETNIPGFFNKASLPNFGYEIIYNSNPGVPENERVTLDLTGAKAVRDVLTSLGYFYDDNTGNITASNGFSRGRCTDIDREGCSSLAINEFTAVISEIPVLQTDARFGGGTFRRGVFGDLNLSGQWSVPVISDASEVPEPSVLFLFGAGAGALGWRRRSKNRKEYAYA